MKRTIREIMEDGDTWEEAEARLWDLAEQANEEARDRAIVEEYERLEHARRLEDFDRR
jgi:hypothetical protein